MLIRTFAEVTDFLTHEKKEYPLVIGTLAVMCGSAGTASIRGAG